jgi:glutamate-1-semialdehyde 2,1-aminomutase
MSTETNSSVRPTAASRYAQSETAYQDAQAVIPGGVNSPARTFESVDGAPLFMQEAEGAWMTDIDGNEYVDYLCSWGPMLFGHADPETTEASHRQAKRSPSFGTPTVVETEVARLICSLVPSVERVRMTSSGTEATMSAARLARGYTGRDKILKFDGHYHGHGDSFLKGAGSGSMSQGRPDSDGIPQSTSENTLIARFNDLSHVETLLEANAGEVAAVVVEPVVGNMGCVPPQSGFLDGLRSLCDEYGAVLIFDEVMTGFRVAPGGAQERYGVEPDLTCLGKIMGGGLPVGAFGGKAEIMGALSPAGPVYQSGTLNGNPMVMEVSRSILCRIKENADTIYDGLERYGAALEEGMNETLREMDLGYQVNRVGSMCSLFFTEEPVDDVEAVRRCDTDVYATYYHAMLKEGVYLPPSQFEAFFFGTSHGEEELARTLEAQRSALKTVFA